MTARKKNVVVVMMTQFPSQIRGSKARSILEALPNQLLFPNGEAASSDGSGQNMVVKRPALKRLAFRQGQQPA